MTRRQYLQTKTRNPAFLWRMVIGILAVGVVLGIAVDFAIPGQTLIDQLKEEAADPEPFDPEAPKLEHLAEDGRWLDLWKAIPAVMVDGWRRWGMTAVAVATGACWLAFLLQAIQIRSRWDHRLWAPIAGLVLGVLSIWPTLFLIYWQELRWGIVESEELQGGLRFFLLGVGLREELSKFLCFLPLLPILARRRDELGALLVAGSVGIGFSMEENVAYITGSIGVDTMGRLLTAGPFHMSLTGLLGLAAYRACVWPREWGPQFVAFAVLAVVAHGLYDAFIVIPALADYSLATSVIFILTVYQFFRELRNLRAAHRDTISLTANFLFCVSTVAAVTFVCLSALVGWQLAFDALAIGVVTQAVMVYLFLREMPETMVMV